ncbi:sensor histidine kinase [Noviherbaspirillum pedocola]|uniref:Virulence sensor protein BvgS n=1 Tax=Noviherbaspirillum pedocola TaxID=2801341 RepID=A0A934T271_9BURK|nr:ATP-binding protein [Noviherbaspirillum pedocola]MBK4737654.1 two-component sensor histidine kinase [Noviherbaspirillum pedocola]
MKIPGRFGKYWLAYSIALLSLLLVAGIWLTTQRELSRTRQHFLSEGESDAASLAQIFEAHTVRTIQAADQAVQFLAFEYAKQGMALDIAKLVDSGVILGDIFNLFTIVDAKGDVILSSKPFAPMNLSFREHISVHRDGLVQGLFVSKPVLGKVSGKWSIQLTRRIANADGSYGGVVVVSMDPYYFTHTYESANIGEHSAIKLVGEDGIVRAWRTSEEGTLGQDISNSELFARIRKHEQGVSRAVSSLDGRDRLYAWRRIHGRSLYVVVGLDMEELLRPYMRVRDQALRQTVLTTAVVLLLCGMLLFFTVRLIRSREQALIASAAKTQFLSNMSHELRTPLNGILGYAEFLREDLPPGELREFANNIYDSGSHLLSLVNTVLDMSRIEARQVRVALSDFDPRDLARQAFLAHRSSAEVKGLHMEMEVAEDVPGLVRGDRGKMLQILNNLLHNAIKFTDAGSVRFMLAAQGRELHFTVADTGCGMSADAVQHIFETFYQADSSNVRAAEGTGLGLAIVRELASILGGRVDVRSARGQGSTFTVTLPLAAADKPREGEAETVREHQ